MERHVVAQASEFPNGARKRVVVNGRAIAVFNIDGELFAILDRCPHQGGSLVEGYLTGVLTSRCPGDYDYSPRREMIRCPWHAWEFNLRTGQSQCEPERLRLRKFAVDIAPGDTLAEARIATEIFNVVLHETYVVLEI